MSITIFYFMFLQLKLRLNGVCEYSICFQSFESGSIPIEARFSTPASCNCPAFSAVSILNRFNFLKMGKKVHSEF